MKGKEIRARLGKTGEWQAGKRTHHDGQMCVHNAYRDSEQKVYSHDRLGYHSHLGKV
jgi:hypothetical protein